MYKKQKNQILSEKKSKHSLKRTYKCKFKRQKVTKYNNNAQN